jgi:hypothetical protein
MPAVIMAVTMAVVTGEQSNDLCIHLEILQPLQSSSTPAKPQAVDGPETLSGVMQM